MCTRDELREVNMKLDHLMHVTCELFAMMKTTNNNDSKLDQCIKLLNNINSSLNTQRYPIVNTENNIPPPPPPPILNNNKKNTTTKPTKPVYTCNYMDELKAKLKERKKIE